MTSIRLFLLVVGLSVCAAGCGRHDAAPADGKDAQAAEKIPSVVVVQPVQKSLRRVIDLPAHIEPIEETPLFARIQGYIHKVHVDIGDQVQGPRFDEQGKQIKAGQPLAEISVPEMDEELRQKTALVAQAQAEVEQATAAVEAATANIATAKALVVEAEAGRERAQAAYEARESEYKLMKELSGTLNKLALTEAERQLKSTAAARNEVEAKVQSSKASALESEARRNKAKADLAAAKAKVQVASAEEGRLRALVEYKTVRAPYDGVITSRNIHTGHYLTGAGVKPLFVITRTDVVRVLVDVPEPKAMFINEGVPARIQCQILKDQDFEGKVTRTSWSLDTKSRTLRAEIHLSNAKGSLRPGMYAFAYFDAELPRTFTLPAAAVVTQGDQTFCYCVQDGKAIRTPLKIGQREGQFVQVLKKQVGLSKDRVSGTWTEIGGTEQVVVSNPASLTNGQSLVVERKN
ncbi:MAG: efflux RND transporter periplasmic adaptor subunit [Gemmataceae bacterium]|nr:efflux RND transporter periplasmic adaptor subunit [Gemmataceae bacterium]